jgi:hypothetical protein
VGVDALQHRDARSAEARASTAAMPAASAQLSPLWRSVYGVTDFGSPDGVCWLAFV